MAITKQKKAEVTAKISEGLKGAEGAVFVSARGINANQMNKFRKELRANGVSYTVAKKSLMRLAFKEQGITGTLPEMPGEVAIAWSADPVAAAKGVYTFAKTKENKDKMTLVGGIYQGAFMSKSEITELASIPSYKELQGKFVGVLNAITTQFVRVLDAKSQKGE
jgi:large subunit ribosomal protein L10